MQSNRNEELIEYPCDFPLKIMGPMHDEFIATVAEVVRSHAPEFDESTVETRTSSKGNYLSVTATVRATSREQLDNLYMALTSHPMVKVVL